MNDLILSFDSELKAIILAWLMGGDGEDFWKGRWIGERKVLTILFTLFTLLCCQVFHLFCDLIAYEYISKKLVHYGDINYKSCEREIFPVCFGAGVSQCWRNDLFRVFMPSRPFL